VSAEEEHLTQARIQIFRPTVGVYYRIPQLAAMWHRKPRTVMNWLSQLRKSTHAPSREQVKRVGPNAARRYVEIRDDYASLIRQVFIDRSLRL
jgi:hypothetical protein